MQSCVLLEGSVLTGSYGHCDKTVQQGSTQHCAFCIRRHPLTWAGTALYFRHRLRCRICQSCSCAVAITVTASLYIGWYSTVLYTPPFCTGWYVPVLTHHLLTWAGTDLCLCAISLHGMSPQSAVELAGRDAQQVGRSLRMIWMGCALAWVHRVLVRGGWDGMGRVLG